MHDAIVHAYLYMRAPCASIGRPTIALGSSRNTSAVARNESASPVCACSGRTDRSTTSLPRLSSREQCASDWREEKWTSYAYGRTCDACGCVSCGCVKSECVIERARALVLLMVRIAVFITGTNVNNNTQLFHRGGALGGCTTPGNFPSPQGEEGDTQTGT